MGGITRLLLLLWVDVTVSTVVDLQKRIIGGQTCEPGERLHHVKITDESGDLACGGSLISDQWILTAAHCWEWGMKAVLGVHPGPGQSVEIVAPPVMFGYNENRIHDIMMLKLPNRITNIKPVKLPDCGKRPKIGDEVRIAGHASTAAHANHQRIPGESKTLQCANIPVADCPKPYPPAAHQHMFCGQSKQGTKLVDACPGDSGGGAEYNHMIYGIITNVGVKACVRPVGIIDVCEYKQWIETTIAKPF